MTRERTPSGATSTEDRFDRLERRFAVLFGAYRQQLSDQAAEIDPALQPSGFRTLVQLVVCGSSGAGALAEALGYDKSVLSRQLHQLEALGLIERDRDPTDRRSVVISATTDAVARVLAIRRGARDEFRAQLRRWPQEDVDELDRLLGNLR